MGDNGTRARRSRFRGKGTRRRIAGGLATLALVLGITACGGGERQDADEPSGEFAVDVAKAEFPPHQRLAEASNLLLEVRNIDDREIPNLAVTIFTGEQKADGSFNIRIDPTAASPDDPGLANPSRPVWTLEDQYPKLLTKGVTLKNLDKAPTAGAVAAQTDTFQFGPLPPGESKSIVWHVTAVREGTYTVHYQVSAGLEGKARAVTRDGGPVTGEFVVTISGKPPQTCVNGAGQVVRGTCQF